jgi:hypothetical protein
MQLFHALESTPQNLIKGYFLSSFDALIRRLDIFNYYRVRGGTVIFTMYPAEAFRLRTKLVIENESSVSKNTNFALISSSPPFRQNPGIIDGTMRSVSLDLLYNPYGIFGAQKRAIAGTAGVEQAGSFMGGDFSYTILSARIRSKFPTLISTLPFPPTLSVTASGAATVSGKLPPQRYVAPLTSASVLSAQGMLRGMNPHDYYGDQFVTFTVEHNFRRIPFSAIGFDNTNLEFILNGSIARTWFTNRSLMIPAFPAADTKGWYYEAGVGISNILDLFRVDLSYRIQPSPQVVLTILGSDFLMGFLE